MDKVNYKVSQQTGFSVNQVTKVISLLAQGSTIPFIARYRKEMTGSLDEIEISNIQKTYDAIQVLVKRRESILKAIEVQGSLNKELENRINSCWDEKLLEDIYLPFKKKQKTKASIARENGLEGLAKIIMSQRTSGIKSQSRKFINSNIKSIDDALEGAQHIIAEWINENTKIRNIIRSSFSKSALILAKKTKSGNDERARFKDYYDYEGLLSKTPAHRIHALLRGEKEGILKVKTDIDFTKAKSRIERFFIRNNNESVPFIKAAISDSLKRLILPSFRNEVLKEAKESADEEAIKIFSRNAKDLLLSPPLGAKRIIGIDPGFRTGCKVVSLDELGNLANHFTIYPHPPQKQLSQAEHAIYSLIEKEKVQAIAIGNGTAGKETYKWIKSMKLKDDVDVFLVNEDGASIYSASEIAREEFPDLDLTVRGAISIGRRLMDPLAELVKIDAKSIGVGQYQHDVNQSQLKESLTETVITCVNKVGINLNTASKHLLAYVSGIGPVLAQNIVTYRDENGGFNELSKLMNVPKFGKKAFEQSAGFLRIKNGANPLDDTGVHPESYGVVKKMINDSGMRLKEILANENALRNIPLSNYISDSIGLPSLNDIITELRKPGLDPREKAKAIEFQKGLEKIEDLEIGQVVSGVVTNITKFGAFLDIGIKESALLHISQIADRYISDPSEILSLNQQLKVKVIDLDVTRKRISVSRKDIY